MPDPPRSDAKQFVQGAAVLHVPDVKSSAAYYRDVLGFQWDFGNDEYCVVWRENSALHLTTGEQAPSGVHLFQWVRDVDAVYREVLDRGANIVVEPADRPYQMRDFTVRDLNGIDVVFGQDID